MNRDNFDVDEEHLEHVDADAVCVVCGEVNPEGTLLCKQCGNNLRDQRARRVAEGQAVDEMLGERHQSWLRGGLTMLGILVVLWTTLNVGRIEGWLVQAQQTGNAEGLWRNADSPVFESLGREMDRYPLSDEEKEAARTVPASGDTPDGRYVIVRKGGGGPFGSSTVMGEANVVTDGDRLLFVARVNRGAIEIRGSARIERGNMPVVRDTAVIKMGNDYYLASGLARLLDDGGYECFGQSVSFDRHIEVLAYRVR